jgi:Na+-transporting methylmalonyl-CoA/oxaloacetate decarboxylase gamma subunit
MMDRMYGWMGGGMGVWAVLAVLVVLAVVYKWMSRK